MSNQTLQELIDSKSYPNKQLLLDSIKHLCQSVNGFETQEVLCKTYGVGIFYELLELGLIGEYYGGTHLIVYAKEFKNLTFDELMSTKLRKLESITKVRYCLDLESEENK